MSQINSEELVQQDPEPNHIDAILKAVDESHLSDHADVKAATEADLGTMREETTQTVGYGPFKGYESGAAAEEGFTESETHTKNLQDHHFSSFVQLEAEYDQMDIDNLYVALGSNLESAQRSEARGDADAAVAKTAAIKNIQKALTARILKRLDDGQPLVEVARKMKAIEGMQPQINDMERRLGIMQSVEPVLENAIKTLQKVVDVRGMGKK